MICVSSPVAAEALEGLRALRRRQAQGPGAPEELGVAAADPLNLVGTVLPGARVPSTSGVRVRYRDGVPVTAPGGAGHGLGARLEGSLDESAVA